MRKAGWILMVASDAVKAEATTFPPQQNEEGTWARGWLLVDGEQWLVTVEKDRPGLFDAEG